ncbi:MAG: sigma-70 family RNA polymerase sigma factor, partial [Lewinella sp.]|nr:sigma-70 family RNA polymerase sigma factor [Lewinella sp.]
PQINIEETAVQDPGQAEEITRSETMQNLHLALARLPEGDREILLLTRFQELKYAEVAQITGSTEGAVKVRAYRAIRQLRELFFRIDAG